MRKCHSCGKKGYWCRRLLNRLDAVLCDLCFERQKREKLKGATERVLNKYVPPNEAW